MSTFLSVSGWLTPSRRLALLAVLLGLSLAAVGPRVRAGYVAQDSTLAPTRMEQVGNLVMSSLLQADPLADPFVTLENGVQVKTSNFNGIEIGGERYYYRPRFEFSGDPVSRGVTRDYQVVLILDAGTNFETEVYQLIR